MPDEYIDLGSPAVNERTSSDREKEPSFPLYRWAHIPALLAFGILFILLRGQAWRWQIAIGGSYTIYVFLFAVGSVLRNWDDFFGDSRVPSFVARMLIPHVFFLALIISGVTLWFYLKPMLPPWLTEEGRKGSLWDLCGWLALAIAGIVQGTWMAKKAKRQFAEPED
jgi:hypothetical protein